jgi:hypothetical protein
MDGRIDPPQSPSASPAFRQNSIPNTTCVLSVSHNGKKHKINARNGEVTGVDLDPDLSPDPDL